MPTVQHGTWSCISSKCRPHSSGNAFLPVGYLSLSAKVLNERRAGQLLLPVELAVTITQKCGSASLGKQSNILSKGMQKRRQVRRWTGGQRTCDPERSSLRTWRSSEAGNAVWIDQASCVRSVPTLSVCLTRFSRGEFLWASYRLESWGEAHSCSFCGSATVWWGEEDEHSQLRPFWDFLFRSTPL